METDPMFSLWKGGVLLGRFAEHAPVTHHGARVGAAGVLEPAESFAETSSVMQTRVSMLPGRPFFQVPIEAGSPRETETLAPEKRFETALALRPLSDQEACGVTADLVLEVRAEDGRRIETTMVTLDRRTHREGTARSEEPAEYWIVAFSTGADRASGEEA